MKMKIKRIAEPTPQQFNRNYKNNNKSKASNIMPAIIRFNESTMNLCMDKSWWSAINYHAFITALVYTTHKCVAMKRLRMVGWCSLRELWNLRNRSNKIIQAFNISLNECCCWFIWSITSSWSAWCFFLLLHRYYLWEIDFWIQFIYNWLIWFNLDVHVDENTHNLLT